jgi:hypothetical protein
MTPFEITLGVLLRHGERRAAIEMVDALARHSHGIDQYDQVAYLYQQAKLPLKAIEYCEKALKDASSLDQAITIKSNLVDLYNSANYPEKALYLINQLEIADPQDTSYNVVKSFCYFLLNEKDKAENIIRQELNNHSLSDEKRTRLNFNLGAYELLKDNFQSGLRRFLFEGRKLNLWNKPQLPFKFWQGEIQPGKKLILLAEAGIGDEFINVRFMKHLRNLGMDPIWFSTNQDTVDIFNRCGYKSVSSIDPRDYNEDTLWTHSMDVPIFLNLQYEDLWDGPYISAQPNLADHLIKDNNKLKVGLRWQGNPEYDHDLHRSVPLKDFYNVIKDANADLYSLQRDVGLEELDDFPDIVDLSSNLTSFEITLSVISKLDIIITSCTSIAHAAAAMGKKVVVFTPISSYYVWCHSGSQSPWYGDNVKLIRQTKPRVWDDPQKELEQYLKQEGIL